MAIGMIGLGLGLFAAVLLRAAFSDVQPIERFQVLDVISDPALAHHAVIYRYQPAGGLQGMTGLWVSEGAAPDRGASERPPGRPVAVWREGMARIGWQAGRLRLVGDQRDVRPTAAPLEACLESVDAQLCLDPDRVTFVPLPR